MSFRTFIRNIWKGFKALWNRVEKIIQDNIHVSVLVVQNFKTIVDSPATDILTALIPGDIDDKIKDKLRQVLPKVLTTLKIIEDCSHLTDQELVNCIAVRLVTATEEYKDHIFHGLAVQLAKELSDGRLTFSDAIALVEWYYRNKVKR